MNELIHVKEPVLEFGYGQAVEDPRDGLTLFGPLDQDAGYGVRAGVIGTDEGVRRFKRWARGIQGRVGSRGDGRARPPFPGFETVFRVPWNVGAIQEIPVSSAVLHETVRIDDRHERVFRAVDIFVDPLLSFLRNEESPVDIWFVVIPEDVYRYCRPRSFVPENERAQSARRISPRLARRVVQSPSLFEELNADAMPYQHEPHFHNQLKGRLLGSGMATQIVRETTIAFRDFKNRGGGLLRDLEKMESAVAWNLATTTYYKTGGRPWKLANIRDGVCYLGMVFKQETRLDKNDYACCAAKMFLDSGDGIVFRGALGPWYSPETREFHLDREAAKRLMGTALATYREKRGTWPKEVFVHGKVRFSREEWSGFEAASKGRVKLVGVRIRNDPTLRLYKAGRNTVLRGIAYVRDKRTAYLWTRGFIPRIQTYPGREVPVPLIVDVCRGDADLHTVLADVMALTKLNYNACVFSDGQPVTLRFADAVGEILTAGPLEGVPPLPFKYYI